MRVLVTGGAGFMGSFLTRGAFSASRLVSPSGTG
jgi:nucleoside-diphosphate-sugar epimerase